MAGISQYDVLNYAQYKPLTTQEIWAPSQAMREQHDKAQEEYSQQETVSNASLMGLNAQVDKAAIDIHNQYNEQLRQASNELATKGFIESGRRKNLLDLKAKYNQQILPLQNALQQRQAMAEEQRKLAIQDPTYRFTHGVGDIALTDIVADPTKLSYSGISGNQLYRSASEKMEQLKNSIQQNHPELRSSGLAFKYFTAIKSGLTPDQAHQAMVAQGYDPKKASYLTNMAHGIIDSTMREYGVYDKFSGNQQAINDLWRTTAQSAVHAIGDTKFGQMDDTAGEYLWKKKQEEKQQKQESSGYLQDIQADPEIFQNEKFAKNKSIIDYIDSGKYQQTKNKKDPFQNVERSTFTPANVAVKPGESDWAIRNKEIAALGRKYKTTNLNEIRARLDTENNFLKAALSQHGISGKDNYALQNIISNASSYPDLDLSKLKDSKGNINKETTKVYLHPTKGLVIQGVDQKGKTVIQPIGADIIGNPKIVSMYGMNTLPKITNQLLSGNVDVQSMIRSGELIQDPSNKGYYMFSIPADGHGGKIKLNNSYTKEELNNAMYHPEIMQYINMRQSNTFDQIEARLQSQNVGYNVNPNKKE